MNIETFLSFISIFSGIALVKAIKAYKRRVDAGTPIDQAYQETVEEVLKDG